MPTLIRPVPPTSSRPRTIPSLIRPKPQRLVEAAPAPPPRKVESDSAPRKPAPSGGMPRTSPRPAPSSTAAAPRLSPRPPAAPPKPDNGARPADAAKILFQSYFKSVGPRTYAAQLKEAGNGNHFLVLTEGKRDQKSGDVRKTRLFVFSEDFDAFFNLVRETADFTKTHPVPPEVRRKRAEVWAKSRRRRDDLARGRS